MSKINRERRSLLQGVSLVGVAASMPLATSASVKPMLDKLQRDEFPLPDFGSHISEPVSIKSPSGEILTASIESVDDMISECSNHSRPAYLRKNAKAVRFTVEGAENLASEVYQIKHAKLGKMDLMLTTVPNAKGIFALEAVFN